MSQAASTERLHFHMCAGQVAFYPETVTPEKPMDPSKVQMLVSNTVLFTKDMLIRVTDIENVQRSFQMNVVNRFPNMPPPVFLDCVILSINYLGCMTQQEFEAGSTMERIRAEQAAQANMTDEEQAVAEKAFLEAQGLQPQ